MKTNLDGKLPKWVIWIMNVYTWAVLGGVAFICLVDMFLLPIMIDIIFGQPRCYVTIGIFVGLLISALLVSNELYGSDEDDTYGRNYTRQARRQAMEEKSAIEVPDVPQKPDVEPKKEVAKPNNERPFTCTWGEVVFAVTFIGTMAIVFILWDFFVGIYRLKIGFVSIPIISMDLFVGAFLLALLLTISLVGLIKWLGLDRLMEKELWK